MKINTLLDYAARYRPEYPQAIRGAPAEKIAKLEQVAGLRLPPSYRAFLATMGEDQGGLDLVDPCSPEIDAVLEYYEPGVAGGEAVVPGECIVFAWPGDRFHRGCLSPADPWQRAEDRAAPPGTGTPGRIPDFVQRRRR